eukprot:CAMPEP_0184865944 /NCGR_PEP_ID=MMETSP0580-20130426/19871_1 /TAXON_ID=1118495 /ORGANISM="Dactyliosolen fragilissimus" /LENGTH=444 /DNA_ID=CAMNT_0027365347 /DNA_START=70 /DNA_END=1401 /DNA_ORIENTATION=-
MAYLMITLFLFSIPPSLSFTIPIPRITIDHYHDLNIHRSAKKLYELETTSSIAGMPPVSPATSLPNQVYDWRSQQIRYQVAGVSEISYDKDIQKPAAVLVHGLFVNSDHWRKTLKGLADAGYRAYALDLLGSGYSSKPIPGEKIASEKVCGERRRFGPSPHSTTISTDDSDVSAGVLKNVRLGTANGGTRIASEVDLRHPTGSQYNFYTWAEQISDFTRDIVLRDNGIVKEESYKNENKVTLVSNSIGTISSLQSVLDTPHLFDGVFVVNPNFRELHSAEVPFSNIAMPVIRTVQKTLREKGQPLFDLLAKPNTVTQILQEPYAVTEAIDETLVKVLLDPLLTKGASDVVFDTLSYSAGPLPEQQLDELSELSSSTRTDLHNLPVWICYGAEDPWTPSERVEAMANLDKVERVVRIEGVGHCPHDEAPEIVNPLLLQFLQRLDK